jgi:hypothetical protein
VTSAGFGVEGAEAGIVGGANEHQAGRRRDRAAFAGPACILPIGRQTIGNAEWNAPSDVAAVDVDRQKFAPGRLIAEHMRSWVAEAAAGTQVKVRAGTASPVVCARKLGDIDGTEGAPLSVGGARNVAILNKTGR